MRFLFLPNEPGSAMNEGSRLAFETFFEDGRFSDYLVYSYLKRSEKLQNHQKALAELYETAKKFQPDVIYIQNIDAKIYPVDRAFFRRLKNLKSAPKLIFNDGDPYGLFIGRLGPTQKAICAESDMVFITGLGYMAEEFLRAGARRVRLLPDVFDVRRFGKPWEPTRKRDYDVIMIGNLGLFKRIPGLYLPGGRKRKKTARLLHRACGSRFAVFGAGDGWQGEPYCKGPCFF